MSAWRRCQPRPLYGPTRNRRTVRVRAHPGSAELEKQADGSFTGDGFVLKLGADGGTSLDDGGKSQGKGCKPAA